MTPKALIDAFNELHIKEFGRPMEWVKLESRNCDDVPKFLAELAEWQERSKNVEMKIGGPDCPSCKDFYNKMEK